MCNEQTLIEAPSFLCRELHLQDPHVDVTEAHLVPTRAKAWER